MPPSNHTISSSHIERGVREILFRLKKSGFDAYLVGGCVRDMMTGRTPKDFDIVTDAKPRQIKKLFRRCFLIGKRFRLAHVYIDNDRFIEVATYRAVETAGSKQRGPSDPEIFGTIEEDALRRDFTVNSLYYDISRSTITDYTGGIEDIKAKVLRSIGDPASRFAEDPVRIIRLARFAASLNFSISKNDIKAALKSSGMISTANASRMLEELYKILKCGASSGTVKILRELGAMRPWIPELADAETTPGIYSRLEAADLIRKSGSEPTKTLLVTNLLYDLFEPLIDFTHSSIQAGFEAINETYRELAIRLRLPKKDWDIIRNNCARQAVFQNVESMKLKKKFMKKFMNNGYFEEALEMFELRVEAGAGYLEELGYWKGLLLEKKRRDVAVPKPESAPEQKSDSEDEKPAVKKRRPRRKKKPWVNPS
jgi:poly(A) polymerase